MTDYEQSYAYDAHQYSEFEGSRSQGRDYDIGIKSRSSDYSRGRDGDYSGRSSSYAYDYIRGGGDKEGGVGSYGRESQMVDNSRVGADGYDEVVMSSRDRDRERERERSRRDRDTRDRRERERRHRDREHDRNRERSRDRPRERDRSPSNRYDDSYSFDGSSDGDSQGYRERDREDRGGEKWMTDTPTNTVLLRGLPPQVDDKDVRAELMMFGAPVKDIRLMRRSTGASRGFAFVEFQNVTDAQRWMDLKQGHCQCYLWLVGLRDAGQEYYKLQAFYRMTTVIHTASDMVGRVCTIPLHALYHCLLLCQGNLSVLNQYNISMHYSTPRVGPEKFVQHKTDWTCSKCGVHNFKRRDYCFKCNISREDSDKTKDGDGFDQVGTNPCNTLIFRGLDALTTEESLEAALLAQTSLACKNSRIIRDPITNTSRGYGFCEMNSIQESTQVLEFLTGNNNPLEVDGKRALVSYAKNTFSTVMATLNSANQTQSWDYQQTASGTGGTDYYSAQYYQDNAATTATSTAGEYDQSYYNQATGQYYDGSQAYDYSQYYGQQYAQAGTTPLQTDTTNAAAAVAQAAIAQANAAKNYNKQTSSSQKSEAVPEQPAPQPAAQPAVQSSDVPKDYPVYPAPDVSTYQFDKSSGYYYDPATGLYYDANSQYYYNPQTTQFMYWDAEKSTYLPAPTQNDYGQDGQGDDKNKKDGKDKKEKVKIAKKIAKDMEKWAKSLNAQKEMLKEGNKKITINTGGLGKGFDRESAAADAGFAILEKFKSGAVGEDKKLMPPPLFQRGGGKAAVPPPGSKPGLVASYGGDSDEEEEDDGTSAAVSGGRVDESKLVDWSKLACLLCKRQFQSKEILTKHTQFSDLHKQNLENLMGTASTGEEKKEYRDRAKERRQKYGPPQPPEPRIRSQLPQVYEQPTKAGLGGDNIGNKLMQKMGWSQGMGLGKKAQGIIDPIQAKRRVQSTGLGLAGSNVVSDAGDTYKESVKKTLFARYSEQN